MHHAGLSHSDWRTAVAELRGTHWRAVHVHLLELNRGKHISDLSDQVLDGDVQFDVHADVTRTVDLRLVDGGRGNLGFDPVDASASPFHRSRMLQVIDSRWLPSLGWVDWPVFRGVIFDFERDDAELLVTAHSMERQLLGALWDTYEAKAKKKRVTTVIADLLTAMGFADAAAAVPNLPRTIPHNITIHSTDLVWPHIRSLAASVDHYVFFDGAGHFRMHAHNQRPVYHIDERTLLTHVKPQRGSVEVNTWLVLGPNPKGPKPRPRGVAFLGGPSSPTGLARHDVGHHLVDSRELQHAKTDRQVQRVADRLAREKGSSSTALSYDVVPPPFLEEWDMVSVEDSRLGANRTRMLQWNLPLGGGDASGSEGPASTVGTNRHTIRARVRHHR